MVRRLNNMSRKMLIVTSLTSVFSLFFSVYASDLESRINSSKVNQASTESQIQLEVEHKNQTEVNWEYKGEKGPDHWGELNSEFTLCSQGESQSPIDIDKANTKSQDLVDIAFNYQPNPMNILNDGHTVKVDYDSGKKGNTIAVNGSTYTLRQFHFHAPSEHTLNGEYFDMEMHLVHTNDRDEVAVIGILMKNGTENKAFTKLWNNLPTEVGQEKTLNDMAIDVNDLLPEKRLYYSYQGSFTTPPCTEGVNWLVLTTPIELSTDQLETFTAIYDGNNRPLQPLKQREVLSNVVEIVTREN